MPDDGEGDAATPDGPATLAAIADLAETLQDTASPLTEMDALDVVDRKQEIALRRMYARILLVFLGAQMLIADVLMFLYASLGKSWNVPDGVINGWLAATVIQLIGVVLIVTRYLFPDRSHH